MGLLFDVYVLAYITASAVGCHRRAATAIWPDLCDLIWLDCGGVGRAKELILSGGGVRLRAIQKIRKKIKRSNCNGFYGPLPLNTESLLSFH